MSCALRIILLVLTMAGLVLPADASYDARGNATTVAGDTFAYDDANQPVSRTGAVSATFDYDGNLKRVKEVRGGKTIYTVYSRLTGGLIYRDEATDNVKTDYVALGPTGVRPKKTGTGPFVVEYTHFDLQGSAVAATDATGAVAWRESYRPFGRTRLDPPANADNTGYTGHLADKSTGLIYMQARYYDPLIGRFYSTDPIGYQDQLNLYAYVANDPVNKTDPTGLRGSSDHYEDVQDGRAEPACEPSDCQQQTEEMVDVTLDAAAMVPTPPGRVAKGVKTAREVAKVREKSKERRQRQREEENERKHGDKDYEEPASEQYAKDKAKQAEKRGGKEERRRGHDEKKSGEGDRSKRQLDEDYDPE